jgi:hypothetical protein
MRILFLASAIIYLAYYLFFSSERVYSRHELFILAQRDGLVSLHQRAKRENHKMYKNLLNCQSSLDDFFSHKKKGLADGVTSESQVKFFAKKNIIEGYIKLRINLLSSKETLTATTIQEGFNLCSKKIRFKLEPRDLNKKSHYYLIINYHNSDGKKVASISSNYLKEKMIKFYK